MSKVYLAITSNKIQPLFNTFIIPAGITEIILAWKSKVMLNEIVKPRTTANNSFSLKMK